MGKNVVVEVLRDEDGIVSVKKCSLGSWEWLYMVWCEDENNRMGEVKEVDVGGSWDLSGEELWKVYEEKLVELFDGFEEEEKDDEDGVKWDKVRSKFMKLVKDVVGEDVDSLNMFKVGGFSVECDNSICVIIGKSEY